MIKENKYKKQKSEGEHIYKHSVYQWIFLNNITKGYVTTNILKYNLFYQYLYIKPIDKQATSICLIKHPGSSTPKELLLIDTED